MLRLLTVFLLLHWSFSATVIYNDIPKLKPLTSNVSATASYSMETFLPIPITKQSYFVLNFSNSIITTPNSSINCSYLNQSTQAYTTFTNCSCSNNVCNLAPSTSFKQASNLLIVFGNINNPSYIIDQAIQITVVINSSSQAFVNSTISSLLYSPNYITMNSFTQSNYGVGSTNVTYTFNFSVGKYIPVQPMIQLVLPNELSVNAISFSLNFYNQTISTNPTQVFNSLIFYINSSAKSNVSGFALLTIVGFTNPQYIGSSSSFTLTMNTMACISGCQVSSVNSNIFAYSNTAGNLPVNSLYSNNTSVNSIASIIVNLQLYAPIPSGGKLQILLPSNIQPSLPISCLNINGYTITDTNQPTCAYNSTTNTISTVNFAYPYLAAPSTAAMSFNVVNPSDTTPSIIKFQTIDSNGRTIGVSQNGYSYTSTPGVLISIVTRNQSQLDGLLTLNVNLQFNNKIPNNGKIQILLPSQIANSTGLSPICKTGITTFTCSSLPSTITSTTYNITFLPSCSPSCTVFNFSISGLRNPAYLNPNSKPITIQTVNNLFSGVIDSVSISLSDLPLNLHNVVVQNVNVSGSGIVGTQQTIILSVPLNQYFQCYGGIIQIFFPKNSTFVFNTPCALTQTSPTIKIPTSYQMYDDNMRSISVITLRVNCSQVKCAATFKLTVSGLSYSYSTKSYSPYSFNIQSSNSYMITSGDINYSAPVPKPDISTLSVQPTIKTTGQITSYNITFTPTLPIDSIYNGGYFQISFPSGINDNSSCSIITNVTLGFSLGCQINGNIVVASYLVGVPQILRYSSISLILSNINNPLSTEALNYTITTYFNFEQSQIFSSNYSLTQLAQGSIVAVKSNNTYGTVANLSLLSSFKFNLSVNDVISITIPVGMFVFTNNQITINESITNVTIVNNSTFQVVTFSANKSASVFNFILPITNPSSTQSFGNIVISTTRNGYASQSASSVIPPCVPMTLNITTSTTSQFTGDTVNITINFNSNPNSKYALITLPNNAWSLTSATLLGSQLTNNTYIQLNTTNNSLLFNNLVNRLTLAPLSQTLVIKCLDNLNNSVEVTYIPASMIAANAPKSIQATSYRSNSVSSSPINLTISLIGSIMQSNLSTLSIYLPNVQFVIGSSVICSFTDDSLGKCNVLAASNNTIITNYPCSSSNCSVLSFNMVISGISNLYADQSAITISVLSSGYLSQLASTIVSPPIYSSQLTNVSINISNTTVSTPSIMMVSFSSGLEITPNSTIMIQLDDLIFIKNSDCSYQIGNITYSGCLFANTMNGYLSSISLKTLGSSPIPINTTINLTVKLTNSYAAFNISNSQFKILIAYNNISVSTYITTMKTIIDSNSFATVPLTAVTILKNTSKASADIVLNVQLVVPINFISSSTFVLSLPKSQVLIPQSNILTCLNCSANYSSEDTLYYYYSILQTVCNTSVCQPQNITFGVTGLTNAKYSYFRTDPISIKLVYNKSDVSQQKSLDFPIITAAQASIQASRSIREALLLTNITIKVSIPSPLPSEAMIKIIQSSLIFYKEVQNVWINNKSEKSSLTNTVQNNYLDNVVVNLPLNSSNQFSLVLEVLNSPLQPVQGSFANILIYNGTILYYQNSITKIKNQIVPYSQNISLTNSNPVVGSTFDLKISGTLELIDLSNYQLSISTSSGNCSNCIQSASKTTFTLNNNSFNVVISNMINPLDIIPISYTVSISSPSYIAYSSILQVLPVTQPIVFNSNYSLSSVIVSTNSNLTVFLPSSVASEIVASEISIEVPSSLLSKVNSCYLNSLKISNWSVVNSSGTKWNINIQNVDISEGGILILDLITYPYSVIIKDSIDVTIKLPVSKSSIMMDITLQPKPLIASFSSTSLTASDVANYTIKFSALNTQPAYISITLPFSNPIVSSGSSALVSNNTIIISNFSSSQSISILNVTNPSDNRDMNIVITQVSNSSSKVIGQQTLIYRMTKLVPITVLTSARNTSNYNSQVQINISINVSLNQQLLKVIIPSSQVYQNGTLSCELHTPTQVYSVNCTSINDTISVINPYGWTSENTLVIHGFRNVNFNKILTSSESLKLDLYNSQNYACASLYETRFLTPETSTGILTLTNYSMSSIVKLSPIILTFNFFTQNPLSSKSSLILESDNSYVQTSGMRCKISNNQVPCSFNNNKTQLNLDSMISISSGAVAIEGLSVGILPSPISVYTYDNKNQGFIDSIVFTNPFTYQILTLTIRIIFPIHTVGNQNFTVLIDTNLPSLNDNSYCLNLNISNAEYNQSTLAINGNQNLKTSNQVCLSSSRISSILFKNIIFKQPSTSTINLQLTANSIKVASASRSVEILAAAHGLCSNPDCDSCSSTSQGEYCFSCRQALLSYNGRCLKQCPEKWFSQNGVCQQCSSNCNTCFGSANQQCLSCNPPLIDDSGTCKSSCENGYVENGYCIGYQKCSEGCSICSPSGFCYTCSKSYQGIGTCRYTNPLPQVLFSYFAIAPALIYFGLLLSGIFQCHGLSSIAASSILSLSIVQFFCNVLLIALSRSVWLMSLITVVLAYRLVCSIAIYESYFKGSIRGQKEEQFLEKPLTHKDKLITFLGHFIGVDAYQFYFSKIGSPTYNQNHFGKPIRLFNFINLAPRILLFCISLYFLSLKNPGDMLYLPLVCITSQILISLSYLVMNNKVRGKIDSILSCCMKRNAQTS